MKKHVLKKRRWETSKIGRERGEGKEGWGGKKEIREGDNESKMKGGRKGEGGEVWRWQEGVAEQL